MKELNCLYSEDSCMMNDECGHCQHTYIIQLLIAIGIVVSMLYLLTMCL